MVIGGGAVGVCCAYALARSGRSVVLLERDALCAGSSWGNSGLLTTSACAPEAAPGVMGQAARWMLDRDGAFRLRPRLDPRLARWLWRFRQNCTADAALRGTSFLRDRVRENTRLVEALARETPHDFGFRSRGVLALFTTEKGLDEGIAGAAALERLGIRQRSSTRPPSRVSSRGSAMRSWVASSIPRTLTSIPANTSLRLPTSLGRTARGSRREPRSCGFTAHTASRRSRRPRG